MSSRVYKKNRKSTSEWSAEPGMKAPRWDRNRKRIGGRAGRKNNMGGAWVEGGACGTDDPRWGERNGLEGFSTVLVASRVTHQCRYIVLGI